MPTLEIGRIFAEYWVRCGGCGAERNTGQTSYKKAEQEARERGWGRKKGVGCVCPDCKTIKEKKR